METLRRSPCSLARRVHKALTGRLTANDPDLEFTNPAVCHELLAARGVAAALAEALVAATREAVGEMMAAGGSPVRPVSDRVRFTVMGLNTCLTKTYSACRCADTVVVPALVNALPDLYGPLQGRLGDCWNAVTADLYETVDSLLYLYLVLARTLSKAHVLHRTDACEQVPSYTTCRDRLLELGNNRLLMQWLVEKASVATAAVAANSPFGGPSALSTLSLSLFAMSGPRKLLDAVPHVVPTLVQALEVLTAPTSVVNKAVGEVLPGMMMVLKDLAFADPAGFRRTPRLAGALAAADATAIADSEVRSESTGCRGILHELFKFLAPTSAAIAASPGGLALLCKWASRTTGNSQQVDRATTAALVALFVGIEHMQAGAEVLPSTLRAASTTWRRLQTSHPNARAREAGRLLQVLATHGADELSSVVAAVPWLPYDIPDPIFSVYVDPARHCWTCGAPRRADEPRSEQAGSPDLLSCSGCRVAVYCSRSCQTAGWRSSTGGHREACPRWQRHVTTVMPHLGGSGGSAQGSLRRAVFCIRGASRAAWEGDWELWAWPVTALLATEQSGLLLSDVVFLVDPGSGTAQQIPATEYAHWPSAVPAPLLARPLERDGGRVSRIIMREHPPRVLAFGKYSRELYT